MCVYDNPAAPVIHKTPPIRLWEMDGGGCGEKGTRMWLSSECLPK